MNREVRPIPPIPKPENRIDRHVRNPGSGEARVQMKDGIPHLPDDAIEKLEDIQDHRENERRTPPLPTSSDRFSRGPSSGEGDFNPERVREQTLKALANQRDVLQRKIDSYADIGPVSREDVEKFDQALNALRRSHESSQESTRVDRDEFFADVEDSLQRLDQKFASQQKRVSASSTSSREASRLVRQTGVSTPGAYGRPAVGSSYYTREAVRNHNDGPALSKEEVGKIEARAEARANARFAKAIGVNLDTYIQAYGLASPTQQDLLRDPEIFGDSSAQNTREARELAQTLTEYLTSKRPSQSQKTPQAGSRLVRVSEPDTKGVFGMRSPGSTRYERVPVPSRDKEPSISDQEIEALANARFARAIGVRSAENFAKILDRATDKQREALLNADILGSETDRATQRARVNAKEVASEILKANKHREIADSLGVSFADFEKAYALASDYVRRKMTNSELLGYDPSLPERDRIFEDNERADVKSLIEKLLQSAREADAEEVPPSVLRRNGPTTARVRGGTVPALPARSVELSFSPERDSSSSEDAKEITLQNVEVPSISREQSQAVLERYGITDTSEFLTKYTSLFSDETRADNLLTPEAQAFLNAHTPAEVAALMVKNSAPPKGFFARMKQAVVSLTSEERALQKLVREFDSLMLADAPETSTKQSPRRSTKSRVTPRRPQTTSITRGVAKQ